MPESNNRIFDTLIDSVDRLRLLSKYVIRIEIFNGEKYLTAANLNLDNSESQISLTVSDIAYLMEYGTVGSPGYYFIERLAQYLQQFLNPYLDRIIDGIFDKDWGEDQIYYELLDFERFANTKIPAYFSEYTEDLQFLSNTLGLPGNTRYLVDPKILQKYLRCKIYKNN